MNIRVSGFRQILLLVNERLLWECSQVALRGLWKTDSHLRYEHSLRWLSHTNDGITQGRVPSGVTICPPATLASLVRGTINEAPIPPILK